MSGEAAASPKEWLTQTGISAEHEIESEIPKRQIKLPVKGRSTGPSRPKCSLGMRVAVEAGRLVDPRLGQRLFGPHWTSQLVFGNVVGKEKRSRIVRFDIPEVPDTKLSARCLLEAKVSELEPPLNIATKIDEGFQPILVQAPTLDPNQYHQMAPREGNARAVQSTSIVRSSLEQTLPFISNASTSEKAAARNELAGLRDTLKRLLQETEDLMAYFQDLEKDEQAHASDINTSPLRKHAKSSTPKQLLGFAFPWANILAVHRAPVRTLPTQLEMQPIRVGGLGEATSENSLNRSALTLVAPERSNASSPGRSPKRQRRGGAAVVVPHKNSFR